MPDANRCHRPRVRLLNPALSALCSTALAALAGLSDAGAAAASDASPHPLAALRVTDGAARQVQAHPEPGCAPMTPQRMRAIVSHIDPDARTEGNVWEFSVQGTSIALVFDAGADRMRLMLPIADTGEIDAAMMQRLLQANFDTALDARYAIARDTLWATFIHPMSPLSDQELISAIAQTMSIAKTFGSTFSSGAWTFGGGGDHGGSD
jgi:hypothetical protein